MKKIMKTTAASVCIWAGSYYVGKIVGMAIAMIYLGFKDLVKKFLSRSLTAAGLTK